MSDQIHALQDHLLNDGGIVSKCLCGWLSDPYVAQKTADAALGRHIRTEVHIQKLVDEAPPHTDDQISRIMALMRTLSR